MDGWYECRSVYNGNSVLVENVLEPTVFLFLECLEIRSIRLERIEIMYLELDVMSVKKETGDSSFLLGCPCWLLVGGGSL